MSEDQGPVNIIGLIMKASAALKMPNGEPIKGVPPAPGHVDRVPPRWTGVQLYAYQTGFVARDEVRGWGPHEVEQWTWLVYDMIDHCNANGWGWTQSNVLGETAYWKTKVWDRLQDVLEKSKQGESDA